MRLALVFHEIVNFDTVFQLLSIHRTIQTCINSRSFLLYKTFLFFILDAFLHI